MRINESYLSCLLTSLCVPFIPKVEIFFVIFLLLLYLTLEGYSPQRQPYTI
jgi:hypothetical protein